MHSFSYLEPVCGSMSSSNCCLLTCIHISQEAGQVVCYAHLIQNFPQFIVIHTVKGFGIINIAEIGVFLELSCFFNVYPARSKYIHTCRFTKEVSKSFKVLNKVYIALFVVVWSLNHVQLFATPMDCSLQSSSAHGIF